MNSVLKFKKFCFERPHKGRREWATRIMCWDLKGIISQYGFEYQKLVFVYYIIDKMELGMKVSYELLDDVDFDEEDLGGIKKDSTYVQCKTGDLHYSTFKHVICNWLLGKNADHYILFLEKPLSFEYSTQDLIKDIAEDVADYSSKKKKRKDCFLYKMKEKYGDLAVSSSFQSDLKNVLDSLHQEIKTPDQIESAAKDKYIKLHCADITRSQFAKEERYKLFVRLVETEIKETLLDRKPFSIDYNLYQKHVSYTIKTIDDDHYKLDYTTFKSTLRDGWKDLLKAREALFLNKIGLAEIVIKRYLTEELYYKDLRDYYIRNSCCEYIEDVEECAECNYYNERSANQNDAARTFHATIVKEIPSTSLPMNKSYSDGCYMFLSSDSAMNHYIDWCGENEK